jgi:hypothetical protein
VRAQHLGAALLASAVVAAATPDRAAAWGNRGHEIVAMVAYQDLAKDAAVQQKMVTILKKHPHLKEHLTKGLPDGVPADEWMVRRAATWPDFARDYPKYHRPTWHYVNTPFLLAPDKKLQEAVEKKFSSVKENHGDILIAFPDSRRMVRDGKTDAEDRAVRLCWVLHLAGDIHQPLHAAALCTKELPGGDRGGNAVWVRRGPGRFPTTLHSYWDHVPDGEPANAAEAAKLIRMETDFTAKERQVGDIGAWADESFELARTAAYRFNGEVIQFALDVDGGDPPSNVPVVATDHEGYEKAAARVARKRMLLAGLRLADVLRADLGAP